MESFFKVSVLFLLSFTLPAKIGKQTEKIKKPVCNLMVQTSAPHKEKSDFLFAGFLLLAE